MVREMVDLGFSHIELSHGIRITLVPGILKAVEDGVVRISSTHNFCPLPMGVLRAAPNLFEPSSSDPRERDQWLRHTRRSLDFGAQVGAQALVCHLGGVRFFFFNPIRAVDAYLRKHPEAVTSGDKDYQALLAKAVAKLRKRMPSFWEHTQAGVRDILAYAALKGVKLGLENRERFEELPIDADFPAFLAGMPPPAPAGYWHDTGHAQIKQDLGLIDHRAQLEANSSRQLGFHLHDVDAEGSDHQAVGSGRVDFEMVSTFWRPEHLLTIELSPRATVEDVVASKERVESLMRERGFEN